MTIETLQLFSITSYIIAGVLLLAAVAQFFLLGVAKMIGDVTGVNARRAIERMRQQNQPQGNNQQLVSPINRAKSKGPNTTTLSERIRRRGSPEPIVESPLTQKLAQESEQTTVLSQEETTRISAVVMNVDAGTPEFGVDFQLEFTSSCELVE